MVEVLQDFGGSTSAFPCRYLGLPLSFRKPRRLEILPIIEKMAGRLKGWKGRLLSRSGRLALINSVLTSLTTYYLTIFAANPWAIKKMDKLRRNFLWKGDEEASGSSCLVSWKKVCAPKSMGGLGIKELAAYSRALRLRWIWFDWGEEDRPWKGTDLPVSEVDRQLFSACTQIKLGAGDKARFWSDNWLQGLEPRMVAPSLFKLATRKKISVKEGVENGNWMRGLWSMSDAEQVSQFCMLWGLIREVQLSAEVDRVTWRLTANKEYSATSAYHFQFEARLPRPMLESVWKVKAEPKVKFYIWCLLQNRNWTADRLQTRGWPHDDHCSFCDQILETAAHLTLTCPFAKEVWCQFLGSHPKVVNAAAGETSIQGWWGKLQGAMNQKDFKKQACTAMYIAWHLWRERNQRVFQNKRASAAAVAALVREELKRLKEALALE
ncbi:unnamed protein product [Alopecurus aequalis]